MPPSKRALAVGMTLVGPADFDVPKHLMAFTVMAGLESTGRPVTVESTAAELDRMALVGPDAADRHSSGPS